MKQLIVPLFFFSAFNSKAQDTIFEWGEGLTFYKGKLTASTYTLAEIQAIHDYLVITPSEIYTVGNVWKIEQMDTVTTKAIDDYSAFVSGELNKLKIPDTPFWNEVVSSRKRELKEVTEANRMFILALKDPSVLYSYSGDHCQEDVKALNGTNEDLLTAWARLKEQQKAANGFPESFEQRYQEKLASRDKLKHARLEVMLYAWHNCNNQYVFHYENYKIQEAFEQLFAEVETIEYED